MFSVNPGQSHVLAAMQVDPMLARCAVRVSFGHSNKLTQVEDFLQTTQRIAAELRHMSSITV